MKKVLKIIGGLVPFLATHLFMLWSVALFSLEFGVTPRYGKRGKKSGISDTNAGRGVVFSLSDGNIKKSCQMEGHYGWGDKIVNFFFFLGFYLMISLAFMIYVFIPWWIPGYEGGLILP